MPPAISAFARGTAFPASSIFTTGIIPMFLICSKIFSIFSSGLIIHTISQCFFYNSQGKCLSYRVACSFPIRKLFLCFNRVFCWIGERRKEIKIGASFNFIYGHGVIVNGTGAFLVWKNEPYSYHGVRFIIQLGKKHFVEIVGYGHFVCTYVFIVSCFFFKYWTGHHIHFAECLSPETYLLFKFLPHASVELWCLWRHVAHEKAVVYGTFAPFHVCCRCKMSSVVSAPRVILRRC